MPYPSTCAFERSFNKACSQRPRRSGKSKKEELLLGKSKLELGGDQHHVPGESASAKQAMGRWSPYGFGAPGHNKKFVSSPGMSPHNKEVIKAAAINRGGGGSLLTSLMEEVDSLALTREKLNEELKGEVQQHQLLSDKLRLLELNLFRVGENEGGGGAEVGSSGRDTSALSGRAADASASVRGVPRKNSAATTTTSATAATAPYYFKKINGGNPVSAKASTGSTNTQRRKVLRSFLWGTGKSQGQGAEVPRDVATRAKAPIAATEESEPLDVESVAEDNSAMTLQSTDVPLSSSASCATQLASSPMPPPPPAGGGPETASEYGGSSMDDLDDRILSESAEIAKIEKERERLQQKVNELKRDIHECKIGWKRSWARCEREIGEIVLDNSKEREREREREQEQAGDKGDGQGGESQHVTANENKC